MILPLCHLDAPNWCKPLVASLIEAHLVDHEVKPQHGGRPECVTDKGARVHAVWVGKGTFNLFIFYRRQNKSKHTHTKHCLQHAAPINNRNRETHFHNLHLLFISRLEDRGLPSVLHMYLMLTYTLLDPDPANILKSKPSLLVLCLPGLILQLVSFPFATLVVYLLSVLSMIRTYPNLFFLNCN